MNHKMLHELSSKRRNELCAVKVSWTLISFDKAPLCNIINCIIKWYLIRKVNSKWKVARIQNIMLEAKEYKVWTESEPSVLIEFQSLKNE